MTEVNTQFEVRTERILTQRLGSLGYRRVRIPGEPAFLLHSKHSSKDSIRYRSAELNSSKFPIITTILERVLDEDR